MTIKLWLGEGRTSGDVSYWEARALAEDAGTAVELRAKSNPIFPAGRGGECVFTAAFVSIAHTAGAAIKVTPIVDGSSDDVVAGTATVSVVPVTISLPQQGSDRRYATYTVALTRKTVRGGIEQSRHAVRGAGLQLLFESVGSIGAGEILIEGVEVEFYVVRRAIGAEADEVSG